MTKYFSLSLFTILVSLLSQELFSQAKLTFGDVKLEELSNKPYKPDPGADAIILSDIGIASLNYNNGFYVELERDIRIRIVNSNGFDYADIEIPYTSDDELITYRASVFNLKDGEKTETKVDKKSFMRENISAQSKMLKFNFPDVHEGSVIEYSYTIRLMGDALYTFVPWEFQSDIPVAVSSLTVSYPEPCTYKYVLSGLTQYIETKSASSESLFFDRQSNVLTKQFTAVNVPAFRDEPVIKSNYEHLTKITFELASINFPGSSYNEVTPTYKTLTTKLLERTDFGTPLKTDFKKLAVSVTAGETDYLSKLKKVHEYVSNNITWSGVNDYTASASLSRIMNKKRGNSADINMILIAMLRSLGIKADPVIISTRSNGSINELSAMVQQFNYLIANVTVEGESYLVDATDPLRPFDMLPLNCINGSGRQISEYESKFVELKNNEKVVTNYGLNFKIDESGNIEGALEKKYSSYSAFSMRKRLNLEGEEGCLDLIKARYASMDISDYKIENEKKIYSDLTESFKFSFAGAAQKAGADLILNPFMSLFVMQTPFSSIIRNYPVDYGYPVNETYILKFKIPDGYSLSEKPDDIKYSLGKEEGKFDYSCKVSGNEIIITSQFSIDKTVFPSTVYSSLRDFYMLVIKKQSEVVVLRKNAVL